MPEKKPRQRRTSKPASKKAVSKRTTRKKTSEPKPVSIVGIGASAGGLAALKTLFARTRDDTGLAFVVVVHLSPDHKSHLAELLQPHVAMPVQQVSETVRLEPNQVYVIPPNANLNSIDTHLRLSKLEKRRRERAPIDHFFRTLADTQDGDAIGVILTGTGSDGTLGINEIKGRGGLTISQDPSEAEFDSMPQSAIATGSIDQVLPLVEIPAAIERFTQTRPRLDVPGEEEEADKATERFLQRLFGLLRARTGSDFSRYKRSTILRRIQRRMQICQIEEPPQYLERVQKEPKEAKVPGR